MLNLAIVGGTGLSEYRELGKVEKKIIPTPFGETSSPVFVGELGAQPIAFLPRHGEQHKLAPHLINYRANLWALKSLGVDRIVAVNAVGGIHSEMAPGHIVVPDQIIDYTYGRAHTFCVGSESEGLELLHVDFTFPYDKQLRKVLVAHARRLNICFTDRGVYGCTQGPRLESAAEVIKFQRDGCDVIGMTGMPEAALARELEIKYVSVCIVVNWAAGKTSLEISMEDIFHNLKLGMGRVKTLIEASLTDLLKIEL